MMGAVTAPDRTVGKLLIAEPLLGDPNFDRSVVLMIEHTDEGALGVVLNRPTELEVSAVLGDWTGLAAPPEVLYMGGPVEQDGVLALGRRRSDVAADGAVGLTPVLGTVGTVDLHREADDVFAPDPDTMWRSTLRRQGGKVSMLAHFPAHPSLN
jgi:putative transcriptional regulator